MERLLNGKICVVTGSGRGIGRAIAEGMAMDGAVVYAADLCTDGMPEWAEELSGRADTRVVPVAMDVTDTASVKRCMMDLMRQEGRIDVLVNNAGVVLNRRLGMITREETERMFRVNVFAVLELTQMVSRLMARGGGGSIVNIASVTAVLGSPGQVAYSASKGAVISLTKSAAKELAPMGIRVNAVAPGIVRTERFEELYEIDGGRIDERIARIGLGRLGTPKDVADACCFLASDRAAYVSGQVLGVDGCASI